MAKKLKIRVLPKFHNHGILSALSNHPLNWVHQIAAIFTGQRENSWPKTGQLLVIGNGANKKCQASGVTARGRFH